ncbi:2-dehydro-3-deoxygalactonokinase [Citrobacter sp. NCU1]|uniref:2-dehydro-3-deoxygalactonokinase n=1 Tax=Citrobacter sp. NCU1 TaxID=2026683 RepID=UPI001391FBDE|nr:2-dehydro-3-deoxygalactonokinase [Citrobacter sp. NCU1]NDO81280.1 2-dehydro-3-deoxygalactonokinase [Citrobacter sp. NCU1]
MKRDWIAVDWGTTNFRAFLMNEHRVVARTSAPCGLLTIENGAFAVTLHQQLHPWLTDVGAVPVLMAGMVGSQQGWRNVPYASLPASAQNVLAGMQAVETPWGSPAWIIPGLCGQSAWNQPDVMRGEEVQLLGLNALHPAAEHYALLPGTHSKHARMKNGSITAFSTLMTGELFSVLSEHSLLGRALPPQDEDNASFLAGVNAAQNNIPFSHLIFAARTRRLSGEIASEHVLSFLSGLLIGYELSTLPEGQQAWVVGSASLTARYQYAATVTHTQLMPVSGDACFLHGLAVLRSLLQELTP